jgi:hypothetical protein
VREPFLTGSVKLKLDDAFPTRIDVPVLLSFKETQPGSTTEEFSIHLDETNGGVILSSASVFDLFLNRVDLVVSQHTTEVVVRNRLCGRCVNPIWSRIAASRPAPYREEGA